MRKAEELQAQHCQPVFISYTEPDDFILTGSYALLRSREGDQRRNFATRWLDPFAASLQVNMLA